ncbi:CHAT domain-containing protein [Streptomyces sp. NPDC086835]|uniref:CHAT domain-containing protein n=1 Tax=Streptomyces sp. NPDC086835 TaxID=3365761 RepID=UPI00380ACBE7
MALAREWDRLVARVRELGRDTGDRQLANFLQAPRAPDLFPPADEGTVAVLNISRWRCDALLVTSGGVVIAPLPAVSAEVLDRRVRQYVDRLLQAERTSAELALALSRFAAGDHSPDIHRAIASLRIAVARARREADSGLRRLAEQLWDEIAEPVLRTLGHTADPAPGTPYPRVWWCPTGVLSLLPLHAAGYHDAPGGGTSDSVLDRVVSSYTPTLRALREARQRPPSPLQGRLLYVAPETPGQPQLASVAEDSALVEEYFGGRLTKLDRAGATVGTVRAAMAKHPWVHFSCHGDQDLYEPQRGGLLLYDGTLTVADVIGDHYGGEFIFLAACKTATGGLVLSNEVITLGAALHYAGFRHVVGTLWSVDDRAAHEIARAFYRGAAGDRSVFSPARSAVALHRAVREVRARRPRQIGAWAPFTHTGP